MVIDYTLNPHSGDLRSHAIDYRGLGMNESKPSHYQSKVTEQSWQVKVVHGQCFVEAGIGEELGEEWIHAYMCVAESLRCSPKTFMTLSVNLLYPNTK